MKMLTVKNTELKVSHTLLAGVQSYSLKLAVPFLSIHPREMSKNVLRSIIHRSPKLKIIQMSINIRMNEKILAYSDKYYRVMKMNFCYI